MVTELKPKSTAKERRSVSNQDTTKAQKLESNTGNLKFSLVSQVSVAMYESV